MAVLRTGKHARTTAGEGKGQEQQEETTLDSTTTSGGLISTQGFQTLPMSVIVGFGVLECKMTPTQSQTSTKTAGFGNVRCCPAERERMEKREGRVEREAVEAGPKVLPEYSGT
jgi:hypothetical protein